MTKPLNVLKATRGFLEAQQRGFEELAEAHPHAKDELLAAAAEFQEVSDSLGPLFAILEQSQVVLHHVRATLDAALTAEIEKDPSHVGLKHVSVTLEQVLPYARD